MATVLGFAVGGGSLSPQTSAWRGAFQRSLRLDDPRKFTVHRADLMTLIQWVNTYQEEGFAGIRSLLMEEIRRELE